jgi:16S rRNA (uracil1498-N3)-methyltransferase
MHRFFIPPELLKETNTNISLPKELAHQVRDVLRLTIGEQLLLLDNSGDEVVASVTTISKMGVDVHLLERRPGKSESHVRIILCQGLLKSARFEWILEKGTELGVATFSPILCRRSMAGLEDAGPSKIARWRRIIQEAAEQCGRARMPELLPIRPLMHALNDIPAAAIALMPWEEEHAYSLREALTTPVGAGEDVEEGRGPLWPPAPGDSCRGPLWPPAPGDSPKLDAQTTTTVILFIGPEGGLMAEEVALAQRHGVQVVSLGPRILRAETAALTAVANVMYELER